MRQRVTRIVALLIALFFLLGVVAPLLVSRVYGAPYDSKVKEYEEKEKSAWQQLQQYEKELNEIGEKSYQLEEQRIAYETELETTRKELEEAERFEQEQRGKFRERFVTLCERGAGTYLEILFSAESLSDLVEKLVIVREIAEYDKSILEAIEQVKNQIMENQKRLEELLTQIEQAEVELAANEAELQNKISEITAYRQSLERDKNAYIQYLAEKEAAERQTKAQAGISGQVGTVAPGRVPSGYFMWPTNTWYITSDFSPNRVNPVTGVLRPHTGTDVGALQGAPIWAAQGGTVVLAEYNGGYGNCVILDHGNGIKTLYGHMSAILVSQGQSVGQGTQIGRVGSTGNSTGPHLHFEVLVDGKAVNPMQFF